MENRDATMDGAWLVAASCGGDVEKGGAANNGAANNGAEQSGEVEAQTAWNSLQTALRYGTDDAHATYLENFIADLRELLPPAEQP